MMDLIFFQILFSSEVLFLSCVSPSIIRAWAFSSQRLNFSAGAVAFYSSVSGQHSFPHLASPRCLLTKALLIHKMRITIVATQCRVMERIERKYARTLFVKTVYPGQLS